MQLKQKIVIWGNDNYNALGLLRELNNPLLDVFLLINHKRLNCATISKYCKSYKVVKDFYEGLSFLIDNFKDVHSKSVLITTGDDVAKFVDKNRDRLLPYFFLSGTKKTGLLSFVCDKNNMVKLASKHGFLIPKSCEFVRGMPLDVIKYPCILKPSSINGRQEFKTKILYNEQELKNVSKFLSSENKYILQEYIDKEKDILLYGCRMNDKSVKIAGVYIKDRWSDDGGGSHGLITSNFSNLIDVKCVESFLKDIDYYGLFSFEYGLKDKKVYFYEVNLRNDGTSHLFFQAGANLPLAWVYDCIGENMEVQTFVTSDRWHINEFYDKINVLRGKISKQEWKKEFELASVFHYYASDDLAPWRYEKRWSWLFLLFRAFLLKYRIFIVYILNKMKLMR